MKITFDPAERALTLTNRGLDFADAGAVFSGRFATLRDERKDYGEVRFTMAGFLVGRLVVCLDAAGWHAADYFDEVCA